VKDALNERYLSRTRNEPSPAKHNRCTLSVAMESETSDRCRHFGSYVTVTDDAPLFDGGGGVRRTE
jgi:hypothetical protein